MNPSPSHRIAKRITAAGAATLAFSLPLSAQSTSSPPPDQAAPPNQGEVVQMSSFVVTTTAGMGYVDANSVSGFKTNQSLLDIPQAELVLTQDFLRDIPMSQMSDISAYAGVAHFYRGDDPMIRGSRDGFPLLDGVTDSIEGTDDTADIDSVEVLKGTIAVLYPGTAVTGTLIKSTKKPLPVEQNSITVDGDNFGTGRVVIDSTGPIGNLGDLKLGYRVVGTWEQGGQYFANYKWDVKALYPVVSINYKETKVLLAWDYVDILTVGNANGILTPDGNLYSGAGYKWSDVEFPNAPYPIWTKRLRGSLEQRFSDSWEMRLSAMFSYHKIYGGDSVNTAENWQTMTISGIFRQDNELDTNWQLIDDFVGKYYVGIFKCQSTFGFSHSDSLDISEFWTTTQGGLANTFTIPMGSAAAIAATYLPQQSRGDFTSSGNPGSRTESYADQIYGQEQIDLIPSWLSVVAGWAWIKTEVVNDANIAVNTPYTATDVSFSTWVPRLGAVLHVTKDLSVYVLDSQSAAINGSVDINNNRLPDVQIKSEEVGVKTATWGGRLVATFSLFDIRQTNQAEFSGEINAFGVGYYIPIGNTTNRGWDGSIEFAPLPGLQFIATAYKGNVFTQTGPASRSFGNMWTLFTRYDFDKHSALDGLGCGFGLSRIGDKLLTTGGETFPVNYPEGSFMKVQEGLDSMAFIDYRLDKHFWVSLTCVNVGNDLYAEGVQSPGIVDPQPPRDFVLKATYTF